MNPAAPRLILLRHGRTAWNSVGRAQGQRDVPLDEVGRAQAARAAEQIALIGPTRVVGSDLSRAAETAAVVGRACGLEVETDARLRETQIGDYSGLTLAEYAAQHPDQHALLVAGRGDEIAGRETKGEVAERVADVLVEVGGALQTGETAVVVAHGACLRVGMLRLLGLDPVQDQLVTVLDNCCWSQLAWTGGTFDGAAPRWRLTHHNVATAPSRHPDFA